MKAADYRNDITGIRAIAVLAVILFHIEVWPFTGGFVGVDVFFVLSGYLVTGMVKRQIDRDGFSFSTFLLRRARRLYPALLTTVLVTFVVAAFILSPNHMREFSCSVITAIIPVSNFYFWSLLDYFSNGAKTQPLLHTWTLSVEWQFYLAWAAFLFVALKFRNRYVAPTLIAIVLTVSLLLAQLFLRDHVNAVFYQPWFRVPEFAIGSLLCWVGTSPPKRAGVADAVTTVGLALILAPIFLYAEASPPFPGLAAIVPCVGTALLLYAIRASRLSPLVTNAGSVYLGQLSYSLYLTHWPVLVLWTYSSGGELTVQDQLAILVISAGLAVLQYHLVEAPIHTDKALRTPARFGTVATLVAALVLIPAANSYATDGWEWRFPENVRLWAKQAKRTNGPDVKGRRSSKKRILLLGDSHAGHFRPMLSKYLKKHGYALVQERGRCFPLPAVRRFVDGKPVKVCDNYSKRYAKKLRSGKFAGVVVAARWTTSLTGAGDAKEQRAEGRSFFLTDAQSKRRTVKESNRVFQRAVDRMLDLSRQNDVPVLFMGQFPPMGVDLLPCVVQRGTANCKPYYNKHKVKKHLARANSVLKRAADAHPKRAHFINAYNVFCAAASGTHCPYIVKDTYLYHDDDHLNYTGSRVLAKQFTPSLDAFLAKVASVESKVTTGRTPNSKP